MKQKILIFKFTIGLSVLVMILLLCAISKSALAQENRAALSVGYTFGTIEDDIGSTSGW